MDEAKKKKIDKETIKKLRKELKERGIIKEVRYFIPLIIIGLALYYLFVLKATSGV